MNLNTRKGVATIFGALIFVIVVVGGLLVGYPMFQQSQEFKTGMTAANNEKQTAQQEYQQRQQLKNDIPVIKKIDDEVSEGFPGAPDSAALASDIAEAAARAGISTGSLEVTVSPATLIAGGSATAPTGTETVDTGATDPAAAPAAPVAPAPGTPATGDMASMSVTISATGNQTQLREFIENLQKMDRNILTAGFTISAAEGDMSGSLTFSATAESFIYRPVEDPDEPVEGTVEAPATATAP